MHSSRIAIAVIIWPLEHHRHPLSQQPLSLPLDSRLRLLALGIEQHDLTESRVPTQLLRRDRQTRQHGKQLLLYRVGGECPVWVRRLEEEGDGAEEVVLRVDDGLGDGAAPVEHGGYVGEEGELVQSGLVAGTCFGVLTGGFGHATGHACDFLVGCLFEVL